MGDEHERSARGTAAHRDCGNGSLADFLTLAERPGQIEIRLQQARWKITIEHAGHDDLQPVLQVSEAEIHARRRVAAFREFNPVQALPLQTDTDLPPERWRRSERCSRRSSRADSGSSRSPTPPPT